MAAALAKAKAAAEAAAALAAAEAEVRCPVRMRAARVPVMPEKLALGCRSGPRCFVSGRAARWRRGGELPRPAVCHEGGQSK